jgi:anti-sigma regulatory factor (Ser/Thr protein kinase)
VEAGVTTLLSWSLPPVAESVSAVRHRLSAHLGALPQDVIDDAVLATSEVVTNAILHGEGPVAVTVGHEGGVVRVEVTDAGASVPLPRQGHDDEDDGGRGLWIVDCLATRWGVLPRGPGPGKTVWFELGEAAD